MTLHESLPLATASAAQRIAWQASAKPTTGSPGPPRKDSRSSSAVRLGGLLEHTRAQRCRVREDPLQSRLGAVRSGPRARGWRTGGRRRSQFPRRGATPSQRTPIGLGPAFSWSLRGGAISDSSFLPLDAPGGRADPAEENQHEEHDQQRRCQGGLGSVSTPKAGSRDLSVEGVPLAQVGPGLRRYRTDWWPHLAPSSRMP